jgi:hypothetical protein
MPKVVRFHETGGPEVLKFEDGRCNSRDQVRSD